MTFVTLRVIAGLLALVFACVALVSLLRLLLKLVRQWVDDSSDEVDPPEEFPYPPNGGTRVPLPLPPLHVTYLQRFYLTLPGRRKDNTDERDDCSTLPN